MDWSGLASSVIGGVIGALAGGVPAWLIARRQSNETLRRDEEQRTRQDKALCFAVHVKLITIINSVVQDWCHIQRAMLVLSDPETSHMEPWQALEPIVGHTDEGQVRFTPEELGLFMAANEPEFMMDLMLIAQRNGASIAAMKEYHLRREELRAFYPKPEVVLGRMMKASITREDWLKLLPYTLPLDGMVKQMSEHSGENINQCREIANRIGPIVQKYFNDPKMGGISFPTDEKLAEMLIDESADYLESNRSKAANN